MKKYLGIIRFEKEYMAGVNQKILTKTYDNLDDMNKWFDLYKNCEYIILENNEFLNAFFKPSNDLVAVSDEEIEEREKAKRLYKKLMGE